MLGPLGEEASNEQVLTADVRKVRRLNVVSTITPGCAMWR